jgi:phosphatidylserine decarboxylase
MGAAGFAMTSAVSRVAAETLRLLPRKRLSRAVGRVAAFPTTRGVLARAIDLYVRAYDVDMEEAVVPPGGFRTFDEFFTRALRPGARPIEGDETTLVSPADGLLEDVGPIEEGAVLRIKGQEYDVGELLGDPADAPRFVGGTFAVVYLSPRDYHRVHAPVSGPVQMVRHVGGTLLPVNAFGVASYPRLFARNERVVAVQQSEALGEVVSILVGAIGVGRISVAFDSTVVTNVGRGPTTHRYHPTDAPHLGRGDELGMFHLGSTVVLLVAPGQPLELRARAGDRVRVGQAMAGRGA